MNPKLSFVMPVQNRDYLIHETLKSIIKQTIQEWELIVVDDHSALTDKTEQIIKKINDTRINFYRLSQYEGKGISAARNFGNAVAKSDYIAVMDSDDLCYPYRAEMTLDNLKEHKWDVVYGRIDLWNPKTNSIEPRKGKYSTREFDLTYFKKYDFIPHPTVAYTKKIALNFPYNSFYKVAEDYDFLSRVITLGYKIGFIDQPLIKYRVHEGSITSKKLVFNYTEHVQQSRGWIK